MAGNNPSVAPWNVSSGVTVLATTVSTKLITGVTTARQFITGLQIFNQSVTVASFVSLLDNTTVIWSGWLPLASATLQPVPVVVNGINDLFTTVGSDLNLKVNTVGAAITYNVQGYAAP